MPGSDGPENLKILKKRNWELTLNHVGRQLGYLPLRQIVEVEFRPWCGEVGSDVEKLRLDHLMYRALGLLRSR